MVRPREFDETAVLEKALLVFWKRGYEGTSISELVTATGLQRQSLYNVFTDKPGLFRAALARYVAHVEESLVPLGAGAGLVHLRRYMEGVLELQRGEGLGACLLVKTAFGPEVVEPEIREAVESGAALVRDRFARVIEGAIERGEASSAGSPEASAAFLYTILNGLSAFIRTGGDRAQIDTIISRTLESIEGRPSRPPRAARARRQEK